MNIGEPRANRQSQQGEYVAVAGQQKMIPVEEEFSDVFSEESPRLLQNIVMEFAIDLIPGTAPISRAPHRMTQPELKILNEQIYEYSAK